MKQREDLFEQYTHKQAVEDVELPSSGSNRRYFRLTSGDTTAIGAKGTSVEENIAFMKLAEHFKKAGLNVPKVYCASKDNTYYLQEDLGDETLFNAISGGRDRGHYNAKEKALIKKTISLLPRFQFVGGA